MLTFIQNESIVLFINLKRKVAYKYTLLLLLLFTE